MGAGRLNHCALIHHHMANSTEWARLEVLSVALLSAGLNRGFSSGSSLNYPQCYQLCSRTQFDSLFIATTTVQDCNLISPQGGQGAIWMAICSLRALGFSLEQYAWEIFHLITGLFLIIYASHTPCHFHCVSQSTSTLFLFDFLFHFYHYFRAQLTSILSPYRYIKIAIISNTPLMGSIVDVIPSTCRGSHGSIPCSS